MGTKKLKCSENRTIDKCIDEYVDNNRYSRCKLCDKSTPAENSLSCKPNISENCLVGSRPYLTCGICKEGYTSHDGQCEISKIEGCMTTSKTARGCLACDYTKGYYSTEDNRSCSKQVSYVNE